MTSSSETTTVQPASTVASAQFKWVLMLGGMAAAFWLAFAAMALGAPGTQASDGGLAVGGLLTLAGLTLLGAVTLFAPPFEDPRTARFIAGVVGFVGLLGAAVAAYS